MNHPAATKLLAAAASAAALAGAPLGGCASAPEAAQSKPRLAPAGPPVQLPDSVASDWAGKVVVADFWATWCTPCRASSPNVQILHDTFAADDGVFVVGVHADDGAEDPTPYMAEHGYTYALVAKGQQVAAAFGVHALPTFVVLDQQGREVFRSVGMMSQKTRREIEAVVRSLRG